MFVKHTSLTRHHRQHKPSCKLPDFICTRQMYSDSFCFQRSPPSVITCFNNRRLLKVQVHTLDIAPLRSESPLQKRSGMARVLRGFHSFTCTRSSAIEWAIPVFVFPAITGILTMYTFAFEGSYVPIWESRFFFWSNIGWMLFLNQATTDLSQWKPKLGAHHVTVPPRNCFTMWQFSTALQLQTAGLRGCVLSTWTKVSGS